MSKIYAKYKAIKKRISKAHADLEALQKACKHPVTAIAEQYDSNTGNYDPHSDAYWVWRKCLNCGHSENIDNHEPGYRTRIDFVDVITLPNAWQISKKAKEDVKQRASELPPR